MYPEIPSCSALGTTLLGWHKLVDGSCGPEWPGDLKMPFVQWVVARIAQGMQVD